jgi:hypothetical protein
MNPEATARSNKFKVKDATAFREDMERFGITVQRHDDGEFFFVCEGGFLVYDEETDVCLSPADVIAPHLPPGEVCILFEVSATPRQVLGSAIAFDHTGRTTALCLSDIYRQAESYFGITPSRQ